MVSRAVAERFSPSVLVEGDAFFAFLASGRIEPWLPESQAQNEIVIRASAVSTGQFVRGGYETVYDGVLGPWSLPTFAAAARLESLHYVVLLPSVDVCVQRVQTRVGHGFDDEAATRKMHQEFADAVIDERHVHRYSLDGVREVSDSIVAGLTANRFRYPN